MKKVIVAVTLLFSAISANAQSYGSRSYSYPGRGYYAGGGHYGERYGQHYAPRYYAPRPPPSYAPRGGYDWSWGGGNRAYTGGRGGGWGGEW